MADIIYLNLDEPNGSTQFFDQDQGFNFNDAGNDSVHAGVDGLNGPSNSSIASVDFGDESFDRCLVGDAFYNSQEPSDLTMYCWVKLAAVPVNEDIVIEKRYNPGGFGYSVAIKFYNNANPTFGVNTVAAGTIEVQGPQLTLNAWHLLGLSFRASDGQLVGFVDGNAVEGTQTNGGSPDTIDYGSNGEWIVGGNATFFASVPGRIDEVHVLDTSSDIHDLRTVYRQFFSWNAASTTDPFGPGHLVQLHLDDNSTNTQDNITDFFSGRSFFVPTSIPNDSSHRKVPGFATPYSTLAVDLQDDTISRYFEGYMQVGTKDYEQTYMQPTNLTVWCFIKLHAYPTNPLSMPIWRSKYNGDTTGAFSIQIAGPGNLPGKPVGTVGYFVSTESDTVVGGWSGMAPISLNQWHMVAMSYDSANQTFVACIDGALDFTTSNAGINRWIYWGDSSFDKFRIGSGPVITDALAIVTTFPGVMQEFSLYDVAMTQSDINGYYNRLRIGNAVDLIHLNLDEAVSSTVFAESGRGGTFNGTGNYISGVSGILNNAVDFISQTPPDRYLTSGTLLGDLYDGIEPTSFSMSVWAKIHSSQPVPTESHMLAKSTNPGGPTASLSLSYGNTLGPTAFYYRFLENQTGPVESTHAGPSNPSLDQWHYVVLTYDSPTGDLDFYQDGALVYATNLSANTVPDYFALGNWFVGYLSGDNMFPGTIDEPRLRNYAISPAQVLSEYQALVPSPVIIPTTGTTDGEDSFAIIQSGRSNLSYQDKFLAGSLNLSNWTNITSGSGVLSTGTGLHLTAGLSTGIAGAKTLVAYKNFDVSAVYSSSDLISSAFPSVDFTFLHLRAIIDSNNYFSVEFAWDHTKGQVAHASVTQGGTTTVLATTSILSTSGVLRLVRFGGRVLAYIGNTLLIDYNGWRVDAVNIQIATSTNGNSLPLPIQTIVSAYMPQVLITFGNEICPNGGEQSGRVLGSTPPQKLPESVEVQVHSVNATTSLGQDSFTYISPLQLTVASSNNVSVSIDNDNTLRDTSPTQSGFRL